MPPSGEDRNQDERDPPSTWSVWCQDDRSGDRVEVKSGLTREAAERLAADLSRKGIRKEIWIRPTPAEGDQAYQPLVYDLDSKNLNIAQDAEIILEQIGEPVVEPVLAELSRLGISGQLSALEVLSRLPSDMMQRASHPSVEDAVTPLLESEHAIVRCWAAEVLEHARATGAIPALRRALERLRRMGVDPAEEPVRFRSALRTLGDRQDVTPAIVRESMQRDARSGFCYWPADRLAEIVNALSDASQLLLYFRAWKSNDAGFRWVQSPSYEFELTGAWADIVHRTRSAVMEAIDGWVAPPDTVVTLEWIAESDRPADTMGDPEPS